MPSTRVTQLVVEYETWQPQAWRVTQLVVEYETWQPQAWRVTQLVIEYESGPPPPVKRIGRKFGPAAQTS